MKGLFIRFNLMVLFTLLIIEFAINPLIDRYGVRVVDEQMNQYYEKLLKGPFFTITDYFKEVSDARIPEKTQELQKEFGIPIATLPFDAIEMNSSDKAALAQGNIVMQKEWSLFYRRLGESPWVIKLGPLKDLNEYYNLWRYHVLLWAVLISLVSLISLIWAYPFWKNLKMVMTAAKYFGEGDFSVRAMVSKRSPLKQLAATFNDMAYRIEELLNAQKLLIHAVSHELRTPISRARFGLEMLNNTEKKEQVEKYADGVLEDIDDLEALVSELLTYTVLDEQKNRLHIEKIETLTWLRAVVDKLDILTRDKTVKLDLSHAPLHFNGDTKFLSRALENLILNAIRYADSTVEITLEQIEQRCIISVCDDGPGIPEKHRTRIFEPFVRLDESRTRESGGAGLGLAIVRQIVLGHNGQVWAEENQGKGACIRIDIPLLEQK